MKYIVGRGGGDESGSSSGAVEDSDSLRSKSYAQIIDLLGEGEWEEVGVGGLQGIYLDDVPIKNQDGTLNYSVSLETRNGTPSQQKLSVTNFTESTESVGVNMLYNIPIERAITEQNTDICRVNVVVPQLTTVDTNSGDIHGGTVDYMIEFKPTDSSVWIPVYDGGLAIPSTRVSQGGSNEITTDSSSFVYYEMAVDIQPIGAGYVQTTGEWEDSFIKYFPTSFVFQYTENGSDWINKEFFTSSTKETRTFTHWTTTTTVVRFRIIATSIPTPPSLIDGRWAIDPSRNIPVWVIFKYVDGGNRTPIQRISGKSSSSYERQTTFRLTGTGPWLVRCTRLTADSSSTYVNNKTVFSSIGSLIEEKFTYPHSVMVGLSFDAEQFSNIPTRSYLCKMLKVKIPTNYDPIARTYTGVWDGTFKVAWTDNPAWCFYDLITNTRYGLGERIPESSVDKWELYTIGQYCDVTVSNPDGTLEPRFTCNLYLQTREEAYKVIQDFCSIFRAITYWASASIVPVQDSPKGAVYAFNNASVIDGTFTYQSTNVSTRYNAANVMWNNPNNSYKREIERIEDTAAIQRAGFVYDTSVVAFGCTSRGMARRVGKWLLYTNNYETEIVTFTAGADGAIPRPGDVIQIMDTLKSKDRRGGRVQYVNGAIVKLDSSMSFTAGTTYMLSVIDVEGNIQESEFTYSGTTDTITLPIAFPSEVAKDSIFIISDTDVPALLYKVVSIVEDEEHKYTITGLLHNPNKYDYVEKGEKLNGVTPTTSQISPVMDIDVVEVQYTDAGVSVRTKLVASWIAPANAARYRITIRRPDGTRTSDVTTSTYYELTNITSGTYTISIVAFNAVGKASSVYSEDFSLYGDTSSPSAITNFSATAATNQCLLQWDLHKDLNVRVGGQIVIKYTPKTTGVTWEDGVLVATVLGGSTQTFVPLLVGTYIAKAVNVNGTYSSYMSIATASASATPTNIVATLEEHTTFVGAKTNLVVTNNELTLVNSTQTGEYSFSDGIDLGKIYTVRAVAGMSCYAVSSDTLIDSRTNPIDEWMWFDGATVESFSAKLYVSTTNDDPVSPSASWSVWKEFIVGDYAARGFKFKLILNATQGESTIFVKELSVSLSVPDRIDGGNDVAVGTGGLAISFSPAFAETPAIAINIDGMQSGDFYAITNKSNTGFTVMLYNSSSTPVARVIDWIAKGYGYVQ